MASDRLLTRDGKEVKGLGTWEQEQLGIKPMPRVIETPKEIQKSKSSGINFVYRSERCKDKTPHWTVRFTAQGVYLSSRNFHDKDYGFNEKKSLKAAIEYRDIKLKQFEKEGIDFTARRIK